MYMGRLPRLLFTIFKHSHHLNLGDRDQLIYLYQVVVLYIQQYNFETDRQAQMILLHIYRAQRPDRLPLRTPQRTHPGRLTPVPP